MKILFISTADYKYGAARTQIDMIMELKKSHQVEPVVLTKKFNALNELCNELSIENYHYWYRDIMAGSAYSNPLLNLAKHIVKFLLYLKGGLTQRFIEKCGLDMEQIDLIHSNHIRIDIGAYLSRKYKKPHIWHIKELNQGHVKIVHYKPACYRYIDRNADAFIAVTRQVKEYWSRAGISRDKLQVIYEGVDTGKYLPRKRREDGLLKLVVVGRIEEAKGQMQVLEALMRLPEDIRKNVRLDMYGEAYPDYKNKLDRYIRQNVLDKIVSFKGYCTDIPQALREYDVGILASRGDAFGTVTAEYMAAGLLAIATYTELAEHKRTGLRYMFGDIDQLAGNILFAYQNREEAEKIAEQGKKEICANFSIAKNANEVYALYKKVLQMENDQLVSVLISIYKEKVSVVSQAIDSIRRQSYENLEIIVLLDYPEHEEMKNYLAQLAEEEPRLTYYINEKNLGLLYSLNKGIGLCHGDLICRMDEDDYAESDRIEKQLKYLREKKLDLVGSYTNLMNMKGELIGEIRRFPSQHKYLSQYLKYTNAVPHPTWLVKKNVYEKLHGYRNIPCADDYDFLVRVYLNDYKMGVIPEPLLRYRINQKGMTQQNIASQKIVSPYLAKQIRLGRVFTEEEIEEYRKKKKAKENKLMQYYTAGKRWKQGEKVGIADKCRVIFNIYNLVEIRQRMACKWILFRDGRDDHC